MFGSNVSFIRLVENNKYSNSQHESLQNAIINLQKEKKSNFSREIGKDIRPNHYYLRESKINRPFHK